MIISDIVISTTKMTLSLWSHANYLCFVMHLYICLKCIKIDAHTRFDSIPEFYDFYSLYLIILLKWTLCETMDS